MSKVATCTAVKELCHKVIVTISDAHCYYALSTCSTAAAPQQLEPRDRRATRMSVWSVDSPLNVNDNYMIPAFVGDIEIYDQRGS